MHVYNNQRFGTSLIGETKINLENRFYNSFYARCGIPFRYVINQEMPGFWRDCITPSDILEMKC